MGLGSFSWGAELGRNSSSGSSEISADPPHYLDRGLGRDIISMFEKRKTTEQKWLAQGHTLGRKSSGKFPLWRHSTLWDPSPVEFIKIQTETNLELWLPDLFFPRGLWAMNGTTTKLSLTNLSLALTSYTSARPVPTRPVTSRILLITSAITILVKPSSPPDELFCKTSETVSLLQLSSSLSDVNQRLANYRPAGQTQVAANFVWPVS